MDEFTIKRLTKLALMCDLPVININDTLYISSETKYYLFIEEWIGDWKEKAIKGNYIPNTVEKWEPHLNSRQCDLVLDKLEKFDKCNWEWSLTRDPSTDGKNYPQTNNMKSKSFLFNMKCEEYGKYWGIHTNKETAIVGTIVRMLVNTGRDSD